MKVARYEDIKIGDSAEVEHTITKEDIQTFGDLSGDYNPLHFNDEWAKQTMFGGRIAHGILTAALISNVIGMKLPGTGTIYLSQQMRFRKPVKINDTITARVEVIEKNDEKERISLRTICTNQDDATVLDGEAIVTLMRMEKK
ncbi:MAG: MaoC family dehydratase [Candidatus Thorarchaeota archaeon]